MTNKPYLASRRRFMKAGAALGGFVALGGLGAGLLSRSRAKAAPLANYKRLVIFNLEGGNDGLNTVIPVTQNRYYDRRPALAIDSTAALSLAGGPGNALYKLHPRLLNLQSLWNDGEVAIINGVGFPEENQSHFIAQDIWSYGVRNSFVGLPIPVSGWLARYADAHATSSTGVVSIGRGRPLDFTGGSTRPLMVYNLEGFQLYADWSFGNNQPLRVATVNSVLAGGGFTGARAEAAGALESAYTLSDQVQAAVTGYTSAVTYPDEDVSDRLKDVAIIVQGGFDTRVFYTGFGGFDTHSGQLSEHDARLQEFDNGLGAFVQDMKAMGVWDDMVIAVISEFGRRNYENGSAGTDHGYGNCMMLIGGGVNGGMYGPDITNALLDAETLDYGIDFRTIYMEILQDHLGVDPAPIFPEARDITTSPGNLIA